MSSIVLNQYNIKDKDDESLIGLMNYFSLTSLTG